MHSLSVKLALAFVVVCLTEAVIAAILIRVSTQRAFDGFIRDEAVGRFVEGVREYYETNGSLEGVETRFRSGRGAGPEVRPYAGRSPMRLPHGWRIALLSEDGTVILPNDRARPDTRLDRDVLDEAKPVIVRDTVRAYVLGPGVRLPLSRREEAYIRSTESALLLGVVGAMVLALVMGLWIARTTLRPLRNLTEATAELGSGRFGMQVPVRSRDELGLLAEAFNLMSSRLAEATRLRQQMTADIAHDLRTPLTVISGYLEAMLQGDLEPTTARLGTINEQARHLSRLVEDLRTLSLADANELSLHPVEKEAGDLLLAARSTFCRHAEAAGIRLSAEDAPAGLQVEVDPAMILRVLGNLLSNAIRHTPGGGEIRLKATATSEGAVRLSVSDTGSGIPADELPRIFDRFYRVDPARRREAGESGLGLAIARSIVEAHKGRIHVESDLGRGTTFHIDLPPAPARQNGSVDRHSDATVSEARRPNGA